jgi:hypothetical protein
MGEKIPKNPSILNFNVTIVLFKRVLNCKFVMNEIGFSESGEKIILGSIWM